MPIVIAPNFLVSSVPVVIRPRSALSGKLRTKKVINSSCCELSVKKAVNSDRVKLPRVVCRDHSPNPLAAAVQSGELLAHIAVNSY